MQDLRNKTAVITGAASGIGKALATRLASEGCHVVIADLDADAAESLAADLRSTGTKALPVVTDVASDQSVKALADAAYAAFDAVHILCNNAGVFTGGACWENSEADYRWLLDVNVLGITNGLRHFVPRMIDRGEEGHIVNTASMAALTTNPFSAAYSMSKAAALSLSECLYKELQMLAPQIGVSALCPELINTGIASGQRNRPPAYSGTGDIIDTEFSRLTQQSIVDGTAGGLDPATMAERVVQGIYANKFYLLAEDFWLDMANTRLDEIRKQQNPSFSWGDA